VAAARIDEWRDVEKHLNPDTPEPLFRALDGNYACRYLPQERSIYLLFSEVRDDEELAPISEFFPTALAFAEQSEARRLVLDIRENSGGNLDLNGPVRTGPGSRPIFLQRPPWLIAWAVVMANWKPR
jgi:hypothetical protein